MDFRNPSYRDLISQVDLKRTVDSIGYFNFAELTTDLQFYEFESDINASNDSIELNLIKNRAYKEAVILTLNSKVNEGNVNERSALLEMIREEQKTFGGSKLFYLSSKFDKILVLATQGSMETKLGMVIGRLNKVNEKTARLNYKIKKGNSETFAQRQKADDKRERIINLINRNLRV
ncbi:MAG: hypothetical protein AABX34_06775 [Nanoarchaeota archaeon]